MLLSKFFHLKLFWVFLQNVAQIIYDIKLNGMVRKNVEDVFNCKNSILSGQNCKI